jgi:cell division transport system permease protein
MRFLTEIEFFIVEAFRNVRRSPLMSFVAIGIVTVSLFIFGLFLLLVVNLGNTVAEVGSRLNLVAYTDRNLTDQDAGVLQNRISQITGVTKVNYISRDEAWKNFREDFSHKLDLAEVSRDNPLPNSFAIEVRTPELLPAVAQSVARFPEIDEVRYSGKLIGQMETLISAVRIGGAVLIFLLFFATLLIVVNTIRLTVLARETDIYIMRLVGATNSFIRWPFVIEGILIGVFGSVLGVMILKTSNDAVTFRIQSALPFLPIVRESSILNIIYIMVLLSGILLGMLGGYISVSRLLKEKG